MKSKKISECTSILVGKNMTADNSFISARSSDGHALISQEFRIFPATDNGPDTFRAIDSNFVCKNLPAKKMRYTGMNNYKLPEHWGSTGYNEAGVVMSATETIFNSPAVLKLDPYDVDKGIGENSVFEIVLPYVNTAREGVLRLGALIEEYGVAEGFGVAFIDNEGLWYLETACGHRWMAARIPDDVYFVSANHGRLRDYDPKDTDNFLASKDLIDFAVANSLIDKNVPFDFHEAYVGDVDRDLLYNYPRVWILQKLFSDRDGDVCKNEFPVYLQAKKKITVNDVKSALRNHYQGTEHDPYFYNNPKEPYRPISIFRTTHTHVSQLRPELPKDIGIINYLVIGMTDLGVFLPFYFGMKEYVKEFGFATDESSNDSAYWIFRKPQVLAMTNFNKYAPIVQKAYADFEQELEQRQKELEYNYLQIYETQPLRAKDLVQEFSVKMMKDSLQLTEDLTNHLFTIMAEDTEKEYPFFGA